MNFNRYTIKSQELLQQASQIALGNQQSAVTNSTLNLQLEGKLSPEITLKALITATYCRNRTLGKGSVRK